MISLDDAKRHVLGQVAAMAPSFAGLDEVIGGVLAAPIVSTVAVPPFANSAMDGFAVRSGDVADAPVVLDVVGSIAAGSVATSSIGPGEAMRIMTGAPMPDGADAVVMVERCTVEGDPTTDAARVTVQVAVPAGNHIRNVGDDIGIGDEVLAAGTVVTPGVLGVLCTLGLTGASVHGRPTVGVMSTGDELVEPPGSLAPGQIYDSNRRTIMALVARSGFDVIDLGRIGDDESAIEAALLDAARRCDAVITSGGVSMGDYDYVKVVLDRIGSMRWMQVAVKPAKPLAFGTITVGGPSVERAVPVFGLPGNPVSSMVSFELFARPALRKMAGHHELERRVFEATAAVDFPRRVDGKIHLVRVTVSSTEGHRLAVQHSGGQGSHHLASMAHADALAILPDGEGLAAGEGLGVMLLD